MTGQDTRRRFPTTSGGLVRPSRAGCLGEGGTDGETGDADGTNGDDETGSDDGYEYPAAGDVVQVAVTPT